MTTTPRRHQGQARASYLSAFHQNLLPVPLPPKLCQSVVVVTIVVVEVRRGEKEVFHNMISTNMYVCCSIYLNTGLKGQNNETHFFVHVWVLMPVDLL